MYNRNKPLKTKEVRIKLGLRETGVGGGGGGRKRGKLKGNVDFV